jgi:hypothetical protein
MARRALYGRAPRGPLEVCITTQLLAARTAPEASWEQPERQKHWRWHGRSWRRHGRWRQRTQGCGRYRTTRATPTSPSSTRSPLGRMARCDRGKCPLAIAPPTSPLLLDEHGPSANSEATMVAAAAKVVVVVARRRATATVVGRRGPTLPTTCGTRNTPTTTTTPR